MISSNAIVILKILLESLSLVIRFPEHLAHGRTDLLAFWFQSERMFAHPVFKDLFYCLSSTDS